MRLQLIVVAALLASGCAADGPPILHTVATPAGGRLVTDRVSVSTRTPHAVAMPAGGRRVTDRVSVPTRATNPHQAMRWRRLRWMDENGRVPQDALRTAQQQRQANIAAAGSRGAGHMAAIDPSQWIERGPDNVGGRTRSLIIHPDNPDRMWAGAVSGGIWHSADAGITWAAVDDWLPNLAICCLAIDPNDPQVLYAGTGEGFFNYDGLGGAGIYKSTDGGDSWSQLPSTADWDNVNRIAVSPHDSNVLLAARRYSGVFRSTDGGSRWTNPYWAQGSFFVAFDPQNASNAVAQVIDWDWDNEVWFHRALYSTDSGASWTAAAGALNYVAGFGSRIELAYAPSHANIVYASCAADGGKIWRSTDGGASYTLRTGADESGVSWYANPLWVDPTDPDFLVTGGYHLYKSTDGGLSLTQISEGYMMGDQPHVDMHQVTQDPGFDGAANRRVCVCTDGGTWCTDDIRSASTSGGWQRRDLTYRTTQFYGAAGDGPSGLIVGGTQDNGTLRLMDGDDQAHLTFGGDGGFCAIDPADPDFVYGEYVQLQLFRSTDGGQSGDWIYQGIDDAGESANFIAPFILDPNHPSTLLAGGLSLWRSMNVKAASPTWRAIRPAGSSNISAIAVAPGNSDIIWIGQNNGEIHSTSTGTLSNPSWSAVDDNGDANPLPDRYVERVLIDPDDELVVYVALGGFSSDNLWRTADGGGTWTDLTGSGANGLPDAPINGLARHPVHPDWLYVGTEVGVFTTTDGGATWSTTNEGPANASVDELVFMHNSFTLLAATHGRGIFTVECLPCPGDLTGDEAVDAADLAILLAGWGACAGCPADLNGDDVIDAADLALLLSQWGPC